MAFSYKDPNPKIIEGLDSDGKRAFLVESGNLYLALRAVLNHLGKSTGFGSEPYWNNYAAEVQRLAGIHLSKSRLSDRVELVDGKFRYKESQIGPSTGIYIGGRPHPFPAPPEPRVLRVGDQVKDREDFKAAAPLPEGSMLKSPGGVRYLTSPFADRLVTSYGGGLVKLTFPSYPLTVEYVPAA